MTSENLSAEAEDVLDEIDEKGVDFLRLQFTDIIGTVKNVSVPADQAEKAFTEGIYWNRTRRLSPFCRGATGRK